MNGGARFTARRFRAFMVSPQPMETSMFRLIVLSSAVALAVGACQQPPAAPGTAGAPAAAAPSGGEVLTVEGVGPLRVGMTLPQLAGVWGGPRAPVEDVMACAVIEFGDGPPGVKAMINGGEVRHVILDRFSTLKTDRGFGPGDTGAAIKAAYGAAARVDPAKYDPPPAEEIIVWADGRTDGGFVEDLAARGIRYNVGGDGRVSSVMAGGPTIQLVEGCG